jgi:Questin oxidase-like
MAASNYEPLDEALEALAGYDIALKNGNSNHAPMIAETLCAMSRPQAVVPWIARYKERLLPRPPAGNSIRAETWRDALGQRGRFADWAEFFGDELRRAPWPEVLDRWMSQLAPGFCAAGSAAQSGKHHRLAGNARRFSRICACNRTDRQSFSFMASLV